MVCEEVIEETVKHGGKARSLKRNLEVKKDIVRQEDDDDDQPGSSNPSHGGISTRRSQEPEEREKKTCTRWQKQTRLLLTIVSSAFSIIGGKNLGWKRISIGENQKYRYYGSHRCR